MNTDWFDEWVETYIQTTGADARTREALLTARAVITGPVWHATLGELGECVVRLISGMRVPKFPNEHTDAIGLELMRLREERSKKNRAAPAGDFPDDCQACGGSGLAVIPIKACVWERRIVLVSGRVITGAVLCDRPGCKAGMIAREKEQARSDNRPNRPTLSQAEKHHGCDLVQLLRDYEREQARRARGGGDSVAGFPELAAILARARGGKS